MQIVILSVILLVSCANKHKLHSYTEKAFADGVEGYIRWMSNTQGVDCWVCDSTDKYKIIKCK